MCVIMVVGKTTRPTEEMVDKAWFHNDDGAGIAWREDNEVVWEKGIRDVKDIQDLCSNVPQPYVVHFRIASIGGIKDSLTHPFPVTEEVDLALSGRTKGAVLFHNGHWAQWHEKAMDAAIRSMATVPGGPWSDSRAMAWLSHLLGPNFMDLLPSQRAVLFTPQDARVFTGPGFTNVNGVWCSNDLFWTRRGGSHTGGTHSSTQSNLVTTTRLCSIGKCTNSAKAGSSLCEACEKKQNGGGGTTGASSSNSAAAVAPIGNVTAAKTGGTGTDPGVPFKVAGRQIISVKEAEILWRRGDISKALLKKFRKEHPLMEGKGQRALKAKEKLVEYTDLALKKYLAGRTRH